MTKRSVPFAIVSLVLALPVGAQTTKGLQNLGSARLESGKKPWLGFTPAGKAILVYGVSGKEGPRLEGRVYEEGKGWGSAEQVGPVALIPKTDAGITCLPDGSARLVWCNHTREEHFHLLLLRGAQGGWSVAFKPNAPSGSYNFDYQLGLDKKTFSLVHLRQGSQQEVWLERGDPAHLESSKEVLRFPYPRGRWSDWFDVWQGAQGELRAGAVLMDSKPSGAPIYYLMVGQEGRSALETVAKGTARFPWVRFNQNETKDGLLTFLQKAEESPSADIFIARSARERSSNGFTRPIRMGKAEVAPEPNASPVNDSGISLAAWWDGSQIMGVWTQPKGERVEKLSAPKEKPKELRTFVNAKGQGLLLWQLTSGEWFYQRFEPGSGWKAAGPMKLPLESQVEFALFDTGHAMAIGFGLFPTVINGFEGESEQAFSLDLD